MAPFLEAANISKAFSGVQALDNVSISIDEGEIHCLVGENGSGKSTLIKIIGGVLRPDRGVMRIGGAPFVPGQAIDSIRKGIQIIYQDLSLFPNMTVAENISFNQLIERGKQLIHKKMVLKTAEKALKEIGEECDLFEKVENLSMAKRQIVAISRALTQKSRLIIMDEPTSAITRAEVEHLFSVIMRLKEKGIATLFVSHKLGEIFEIAENVTILRDGNNVGSYPAGDLDDEKLTFPDDRPENRIHLLRTRQWKIPRCAFARNQEPKQKGPLRKRILLRPARRHPGDYRIDRFGQNGARPFAVRSEQAGLGGNHPRRKAR